MLENYDQYMYPAPPEPPRRRGRHGRVRSEPSEFHDALTSFGLSDNTGRLSDGEMARQYVEEIGYLAKMGSYHLGRALDSAAEFLDRIL